MFNKVSTLLSVFLVVGSGVVLAHGGATGMVKERMELMESLGDSMKRLTAIMRGKEEYDADTVKMLAVEIGGHGGEAMTSLFPEGSNEEPSEALPAIWVDWDRFVTLANQLEAYGRALEKSADNDRDGVGSGMIQGGMMDGSSMMNGGGMMMDSSSMMGENMMGENGPSEEHLAQMPPDAAFMHITQTCSQCHEQFRLKK